MTRIYPLIICGGNGTRLWPVSRTQSPKQFQKVGGEASLTFFQSAVQRHRGAGYGRPCIVSAWRHRAIVAEQLAAIGVEAEMIHEPMGRNTGPAVLAAAMTLYARDPAAQMVVVPADHVIDGDLDRTILSMRDAAAAGHIITFGIKPRYAETGFGYITDGGPIIAHPGLHKVERFVEKPPRRKARLLVESDIAYWASGLSMFTARTIIEEYHRFDPGTVAAVRAAIANGEQAEGGLHLAERDFATATSAPTESMVFEKTERIALAPLDVTWSDVGSWTAMYGISESDAQGNVLQGDVISVGSRNSMVRSTSRLVTLVGMEDVIVVDTPDALLVTKVGHCQSVKKIAEHLKSGNRIEAERHSIDVTAPDGQDAAASAMVEDLPDAVPGMTQLLRTGSLHMASAVLGPGQVLALDPVTAREMMVAKGAVTLTCGKTSETLNDGARVELGGEGVTLLMGSADAGAEIVVVTRFAQAAPDTPVSRPQGPMRLTLVANG